MKSAAPPAAGVDLAEAREQEREEGRRERAVRAGDAVAGGLHRGRSVAARRRKPPSSRPVRRPPLVYPWHFMRPSSRAPTSGSRFRPLAAQPDFPAQEHRILALWRERRTFERLRAQNAGNEHWSFLDGPITANNPMGVHHAWGRTYKDLYQRFHAMLGEDQRWQNGFDCQGLWVEVNVERELGYTSKRDIERNGIADFVSLCKQRVLTYAAHQTEQSIRLGMWMDWNDPDELRRLRDLLAEDPMQVITVEGPDGPVTDTVEMIVGRLGMPELGGSYFTFSNENNDLIWGFLAECHKRGWLYKGHDSMPWCARCGTGMSQMEMNEGYQDREDPGLTVRFPLVDRPGEHLLVWTTTPWTHDRQRGGCRGPELAYVQVRQGDDRYWLGKGTLKTALRGPFEVLEERPGRGPRGLALRRARSTSWRPSGRRSRATTSDAASTTTGWWPGRRSARTRAPASSTSRPAAARRTTGWARRWGCRSSRRSTSAGTTWRASAGSPGWTPGGRAAGRGAPRGARLLLPPGAVQAPLPALLALRHAAPLPRRGRVVHLHGPGYDVPRGELTREQVDRSLRYQIMDVVDDIRWLPGFGYERELDWLRTMGDWIDLQEALLGPGAAHLGVRRLRRLRRHRRPRGAARARGRGLGDVRGPHAPPAVRGRGARSPAPACGGAAERIRDVGNPWLDAGIVPFSTLHYREDPALLGAVVPGRLHHRVVPGPVPQLVLLDARHEHRAPREAPFKTILGYATLFGEDGRPMHKSWGNAIEFNEAAERMGVDVMRWMYARQRPEDNILFGYHAADEARRELLVLWNVVAFLVTYARLGGWTPDAARRERRRPGTAVRTRPGPLDLSRVAAGWRRSAAAPLADFDARAATLAIGAFIDDLSQWYLRRSRRRLSRNDDAADREAAFGDAPPGARGADPGRARPSCRSWPRSCTRCWSRSQPRPSRSPTCPTRCT